MQYITKNITIREKTLNLKIWDFPGVLRYKTITGTILKRIKVKALIFVYDITDR